MLRNAFVISLIVLTLSSASIFAQPTPPMQPKLATIELPSPVVLPAPSGVSSDVPNRPLTGDEAVLIALHHQPSIAGAAGALTAAQGSTQQARSGLLPSLTAGTGYLNVTSSPNGLAANGVPGSSGTGYQTSASIRQLIFDFNHTRDLVLQQASLEKSANANLTRAESDLMLQVKQAFYNYVQDVRLVVVNEQNLRNAQSHEELAAARLNTGLGLPSDVVRAQTAVADAILNLNLAQNAASVGRVNLAQLMGIDPRTPVQVAETDELSVSANNVDELVAQGLWQRPDVVAAQQIVQAGKYAVTVAKTSNAPAIAANLSWIERGTSIDADQSFVEVGVALQFTPFDSGLTAGRVKQARGNLQTAQSLLDSTRLQVISDVSQAYLNLKTAEQRVVTANAEVSNAEENERLAQGRYKSGLGTFLDILDAQTALVTANSNRINAQSAVNQARAALQHAIGAPVPTTVDQPNK